MQKQCEWEENAFWVLMCVTNIIETHGYHLLKMVQMGWVPITGPVSEGKYLPWKKINDARQTVDVNDLVQMETVGGDSGRSYPLSAHHYTSYPVQCCPSLNRKLLVHITSFLACFFFFLFFLIWVFFLQFCVHRWNSLQPCLSMLDWKSCH